MRPLDWLVALARAGGHAEPKRERPFGKGTEFTIRFPTTLVRDQLLPKRPWGWQVTNDAGRQVKLTIPPDDARILAEQLNRTAIGAGQQALEAPDDV